MVTLLNITSTTNDLLNIIEENQLSSFDVRLDSSTSLGSLIVYMIEAI